MYLGHINNLGHSNPGTEKDSRRKTHVIYDVQGKSPQDLAAMTEDEARPLLIGFVDVMAKQGLKGQKHLNPETGEVEQHRKADGCGRERLQ